MLYSSRFSRCCSASWFCKATLRFVLNSFASLLLCVSAKTWRSLKSCSRRICWSFSLLRLLHPILHHRVERVQRELRVVVLLVELLGKPAVGRLVAFRVLAEPSELREIVGCPTLDHQLLQVLKLPLECVELALGFLLNDFPTVY